MGRRRTFAQVAAQAGARERAAVLAQFDRQQADIAALVERRAMDAESASLLATRLTTISEQIAQGLHIPEGE